jgi:peptidoglycan/LPS O-acetylase OafA/YrhL
MSKPGLSNRSRRIPELDGLRGIAILLVLIYHFVIIPGGLSVASASLPAYLIALGKLSWSGVDLFFVLSGFLIGGILLDARTSRNYFKAFYMRRFHRILPIYLAMCLVLWIVSSLSIDSWLPALGDLFGGTRPPWYVYATFTQNIWMALYGWGPGWLSVTWSLAIEEQFYLTLPFIIWRVKPARLPYILAIVALAAPVIRALIYFNFPYRDMSLVTYVLTPCRTEGLMLGVAAALFVRRPDGWDLLMKHKRLLYGSLIVFSIGMVLLTLSVRRMGAMTMATVSYTWIALFYVCVLLIGVSQKTGLLSRLLRNRALMSLGGIAYGTYLFHPVVQNLCYRLIRHGEARLLNLSDVGVGLLALIITLTIAKLSWSYFEKPLVKRGHKYSYGPERLTKQTEANIPASEFEMSDKLVQRSEG